MNTGAMRFSISKLSSLNVAFLMSMFCIQAMHSQVLAQVNQGELRIANSPYFLMRSDITSRLDRAESPIARQVVLSQAMISASGINAGPAELEIVRWIGVVAKREGMAGLARVAFEHVLNTDERPGGRADAYRLLAQTYGRHHSERERLYRLALLELNTEGDPSFVSADGAHEIWIGLGQALEQQDRWHEAASIYEQAANQLAAEIDAGSIGALVLRSARAYARAGQASTARQVYEIVLACYPETLVNEFSDIEHAVRIEAAKLIPDNESRAAHLSDLWRNHVKGSKRKSELWASHTIYRSIRNSGMRDQANALLSEIADHVLSSHQFFLGEGEPQTNLNERDRNTLVVLLVDVLTMSPTPDTQRLRQVCTILLGPIGDTLDTTTRDSVAARLARLDDQ